MSLGRIRASFILLAALLLIPIGLLLQRTFESVSAERAARHRAVSDRIFDELERSLTEFLRSEEARPPSHYGYYLEGSLNRSPLAEMPHRDFVLGYFQIDGEGRVTSPHRPIDEAAARARGDWGESELLTQRLLRIESVLQQLRTVQLDDASTDMDRVAQSPGSTQTLQEVGVLAKKKAPRKEEVAEAEDSSLYSALEQLNLGLKRRRSSSREEATKKSIYMEETNEEMADSSSSSFGASLARAPSAAMEEERDAAEPMATRAEVARSFPRLPAPAPMTSTRVEGGLLLLHRTLPSNDGGTVQQGMLIDVARLTSWLREHVLGESSLGSLVEI